MQVGSEELESYLVKNKSRFLKWFIDFEAYDSCLKFLQLPGGCLNSSTYAPSITNLPQFQELLIQLKANYAH